MLIYIIGKWLSVRAVHLIDRLLESRHADLALRGFVAAVLSTVFFIVVILAAVQQLALNVTSLLAVLGAAGLAIGLALKDSLSNFAAGVMLIVFRPFHVGDWIEAAGAEGEIEGITIFHTLINSGDNKQIIVPNSKIYEGTITNYSAKPTRRIDLVIGVGYADDLKRANALMLEVIGAESRILIDPVPLVAVNELADSSVNFEVRPWVERGDYWPVRRLLIENFKAAFDANGISIPFPHAPLPDNINPSRNAVWPASDALIAIGTKQAASDHYTPIQAGLSISMNWCTRPNCAATWAATAGAP